MDTRVLSLVARSGVRKTLVTLLDQLQRCQKSLNEFLEVCLLIITRVFLCLLIYSSSGFSHFFAENNYSVTKLTLTTLSLIFPK